MFTKVYIISENFFKKGVYKAKNVCYIGLKMCEKMGKNGQEKKTKKEGLLPLLLPPRERKWYKERDTPHHTPTTRKKEQKEDVFKKVQEKEKLFSSKVTLQALRGYKVSTRLHSFRRLRRNVT